MSRYIQLCGIMLQRQKMYDKSHFKPLLLLLCALSMNEGLMMLAAILENQEVKCSRITLEHLATMDKEMNCCKLKAVMATRKRLRRVLKSQFIAAESSRRIPKKILRPINLEVLVLSSHLLP